MSKLLTWANNFDPDLARDTIGNYLVDSEFFEILRNILSSQIESNNQDKKDCKKSVEGLCISNFDLPAYQGLFDEAMMECSFGSE